MLKYILVGLACIPNISQARVHTILTSYAIQTYKIQSNEPRDPISKKEVHRKNPKLTDIISAAAERHNIDEKLLHAIIRTESSYNKDATSPKGAVGYMQLMLDTAIRFGCFDRKDPNQNINGGTKYIKYLFTLFDDIKLVVAAYNAGENAVIRYGNKIPPYPETQDYVKKVLSRYRM